MRLNQFLDKLATTPRAWFLDAIGGIRMRDLDTGRIHCPLSRVGQELGIPDSAAGARMGGYVGEDMGLSEGTTGRVMRAADDDPAYPALRRRLLRACGLRRRGAR
jgi:hypothetical protein